MGLLHQAADTQNCVLLLFPMPALGSLWRGGGGLSALQYHSSLPPTPLIRPGLPAHPSPQICKGASAEERLQWHLPEGAAFSWLPNPERALEGRRSLAQHPGQAQQHPPSAQGLPPSPLDAPADQQDQRVLTRLWFGFLFRGLF